MSETYTVRKVTKPKVWEVSKFGDGNDSESEFFVSERSGHYHCNCPGFYRQKIKAEHKHILLVKYFRENLNEKGGYMFWFDTDNSIKQSDIFAE